VRKKWWRRRPRWYRQTEAQGEACDDIGISITTTPPDASRRSNPAHHSDGLGLVSEGGLQPASVGCNPVHLIVYVRHEAPSDPARMKGTRRWAVAAAR
jgi:hypothetical protein